MVDEPIVAILDATLVLGWIPYMCMIDPPVAAQFVSALQLAPKGYHEAPNGRGC